MFSHTPKRVKLNGYTTIPPEWQMPAILAAIALTVLLTFLQELL